MPDQVNQFYECDNPSCRLRFPGFDGYPRWNRCPACRSTTHIVASVAISPERRTPGEQINRLQLEVILDNIRSAWNVGAILRTADGIGINKLYLCGITPAPDNPKVIKTALGAEMSLAWEKVNNGVLLAKDLKSRGYSLWALEDTAGSQSLFHVEVEKNENPVCMVVGNEVNGVDPGILEECDKVIAIPMLGKKQSYNVAVAFGIAASFFLYRQSFSQGSRKILPST